MSIRRSIHQVTGTTVSLAQQISYSWLETGLLTPQHKRAGIAFKIPGLSTFQFLINFEPGGSLEHTPGDPFYWTAGTSLSNAETNWRESRVMNWKHELDALIESTMAMAKDIKREPIRLPRTAEQALADMGKPVAPHATNTPIVLPMSERDEIRRRVSNFKAHQEKTGREREDYYLQVKARMITAKSSIAPKKNPPA